MFEEIITEAAELLAEKQLGLDRKKDSDKGNLPKVLVSFRQIYENELTEQFVKVCAAMKFKYNIRKLSSETMREIANSIKDVVEDAVKGETTVSISSIFQNKSIIEIAEKECSEQKRKENSDKVAVNPEANENIKLKENNSEEKIASAEQAANVLGRFTNTHKKIREAIRDITLENMDEKIEEIKRTMESEEAKEVRRKEIQALEYFRDNGTEEEKHQASVALKAKEAIDTRRGLSEKQQKETRSDVSANLFNYMIEAYNPIYLKGKSEKEWLETLKTELQAAVLIDGAFSKKEKLELNENFEICNTIDDVTKVIAKKMNELNVERGEAEIDVTTLQENARMASQPRKYEDIEVDKNLKNRDIILSESYSKMYLGGEDREKVAVLLEQLNSNDPNISYDFGILNKIKKIDRNFYYSMARNIGVAARETNNPELQKKFDELVDKEAREQLHHQTKNTVIEARLKLSPENQRKKKTDLIGILYNFLADTYHSDISMDKLKKEIGIFLQLDKGFSEQEKVDFLNKIREVSSQEQFRDVVYEKMNELAVEKGKEPLDKQRIFDKAIRGGRLADFQKAQARAKIVFDEGLYNRYKKFQDDLKKRKTRWNV